MLSLLEVEGFIPSSGRITVQVNEATFIHDDRTDIPMDFTAIQPNQRLEVKGTFSGANLVARVIEIKSTSVMPSPPPIGACVASPTASWADFFTTTFPLFGELQGTLTDAGREAITVNGLEVVRVQETRFHIDDNSHVCVDALSGWIGQQVEVKVAFAASTAVAQKVEIKTIDDTLPPPPPPSPSGGTIIEITLDHEEEHALVNITNIGWVKIAGAHPVVL